MKIAPLCSPSTLALILCPVNQQTTLAGHNQVAHLHLVNKTMINERMGTRQRPANQHELSSVPSTSVVFAAAANLSSAIRRAFLVTAPQSSMPQRGPRKKTRPINGPRCSSTRQATFGYPDRRWRPRPGRFARLGLVDSPDSPRL